MTIEHFRNVTQQTFDQLQLSYVRGEVNTADALEPIRVYVTQIINAQQENMPELLNTLRQMQTVMHSVLGQLTDPVAQQRLINKTLLYSSARDAIQLLNVFSSSLPAHFDVTFLASINERLMKLPDLAARIAEDQPFCAFLATYLSQTPECLFHTESLSLSGKRHFPKTVGAMQADNHAFMTLYGECEDESDSLLKTELDLLIQLKPSSTESSLAKLIQQSSQIRSSTKSESTSSFTESSSVTLIQPPIELPISTPTSVPRRGNCLDIIFWPLISTLAQSVPSFGSTVPSNKSFDEPFFNRYMPDQNKQASLSENS